MPTSLLPTKMFRAHDSENNRGMFFVLAHKFGNDGKVFWRPDSDGIPSADQWVEEICDWKDVELAKIITRVNEIPIDEGTKSITMICASMSSAPKMKVGTA